MTTLRQTEPDTGSSVAQAMSTSLFEGGIDVSDERAAILHLVAAGFSSGEINRHLDAAADAVRAQIAASPLLEVA